MHTYHDASTGEDVIDITPESVETIEVVGQAAQVMPGARQPPCPVVPPGMVHMRSATIGGVSVVAGFLTYKIVRFFL